MKVTVQLFYIIRVQLCTRLTAVIYFAEHRALTRDKQWNPEERRRRLCTGYEPPRLSSFYSHTVSISAVIACARHSQTSIFSFTVKKKINLDRHRLGAQREERYRRSMDIRRSCLISVKSRRQRTLADFLRIQYLFPASN